MMESTVISYSSLVKSSLLFFSTAACSCCSTDLISLLLAVPSSRVLPHSTHHELLLSFRLLQLQQDREGSACGTMVPLPLVLSYSTLELLHLLLASSSERNFEVARNSFTPSSSSRRPQMERSVSRDTIDASKNVFKTKFIKVSISPSSTQVSLAIN